MVKLGVTLCLGDETLLVEQAITQVSKRLFKDNPSVRELNTHRFTIPDHALSQALTEAGTTGFLADQRLIILEHVDKLNAQDLKSLLQAVKTHKNAYWVWVSEEPKFAQIPEIKAILSNIESVTCRTPWKEGDLKGWMRKRFEASGKSVEPLVLDILIEKVGRKMSLLDNQIDLLCLYAADQKTVAAADAEKLLGETVLLNVFDLYNAILDADTQRALNLVENLKRNGYHPMEIHAALARQFDRYFKARNLLDQGYGAADIARELKISNYFVDSTVSRARSAKTSVLYSHLELLAGYETEVKTGMLPDEAGLDGLVFKMLEVARLGLRGEGIQALRQA